jgi:FkbM family methyltransferase
MSEDLAARGGNAGFVRRLMERSVGRLVFTRRLPAASGRGLIRVSGRVGGLKYLFKSAKQWYPELLTVAETLVLRDSHVWDVGANVGLFSKAAAFHAGPGGSVLSIEADLDAVALLAATAKRKSNAESKVTVLPVAIADTQGVVTFAIARRARAANAISGFGSSQTGGLSELRTLPCMTLDSLLPHFPPPDVLKIDVEGAELLVLKGGLRVLGHVRPRIYCEVGTATRAEVCEFLLRLGYEVWNGSGYNHRVRNPVDDETSNIVALPVMKAGV